MFKFSTLVASIAVAVGFTVVPSVVEAAEISVRQQNSINQYGNWSMQKPNGLYVSGDEQFKNAGSLNIGKHSLTIQAPFSAVVNITATQGGNVLYAGVGDSVSFTVDNDLVDVDVVISYTFGGTVTVDSEPRGQRFTLTTNKFGSFTGVTPQTFTDMVPTDYVLYLEELSGCETPKPLFRKLENNKQLLLVHTYKCGVPVANQPVVPTPQPVVVQPQPVVPTPIGPAPVRPVIIGDNVRIGQKVNRKEAVAGQTVLATITVRNIDGVDLHNVVVTEHFDPSKLSIVSVPNGGTLQGDTVRWIIPRLGTDQAWRVTVPVQLNSDFEHGDMTILTAKVAGGLNANATVVENLVASASVGAPRMPVTGGAMDLLFVFTSLAGAAVSTVLTRRIV